MSMFAENRNEPLDDDGRWKDKKWKPTIDKPLPPTRCTAKTEQGTQCSNTSVSGHTRCGAHSGPMDIKNAQQRVEGARLRLVGLVDDAIDGLEELMAPGTGEAVRLKAIENVLDRTGLTKGQDITLQVEQQNRGAEIVAEKLLSIRERKEKDEQRRQQEIDESIIEVTEEPQ